MEKPVEDSAEEHFPDLFRVPRDAEIRAIPADAEKILVEDLTDARLAALAGHPPGLRDLVTDGNATVTDAGLAVLARFHRLASIDLEWSRVTDAGLHQLAALRTLAWVDVGFTGVTAAGLAWLRDARPDLEVSD